LLAYVFSFLLLVLYWFVVARIRLGVAFDVYCISACFLVLLLAGG